MFHSAGYKIILLTTIAIGVSFIFIENFATDEILNRSFSIAILVVYLFILNLFRNPKRTIHTNEKAFLAPVDASVTNIEDYTDSKGNSYTKVILKNSIINTNIIRSPLDCTLEEIIETPTSNEKNLSKIVHLNAGKLFKELVKIQIEPSSFGNNASIFIEKNTTIQQGEEIGFIKFDGQLTLFLPKSVKLEVRINDRVKAGENRIATF